MEDGVVFGYLGTGVEDITLLRTEKYEVIR
jgi:hypothetical protein